MIPDAFVPLRFKAKRSFAERFGDYTVKEAIRFEGTEEGAYFILYLQKMIKRQSFLK